jgi:hypothetical protein
MEILFDLNRKAVTKKARNNMVDIHSEKVLKSWLDKNELERKLREVTAEIASYSKQKIKDAEGFIKARAEDGANPKEGMSDLVAKLIGKQALEDQMRQATLQYDFFVDVVMTLKKL